MGLQDDIAAEIDSAWGIRAEELALVPIEQKIAMIAFKFGFLYTPRNADGIGSDTIKELWYVDDQVMIMSKCEGDGSDRLETTAIYDNTPSARILSSRPQLFFSSFSPKKKSTEIYEKSGWLEQVDSLYQRALTANLSMPQAALFGSIPQSDLDRIFEEPMKDDGSLDYSLKL